MRYFTFYKHLLSLVLLMCSLAGVQAQATYLCNEKFSSKTPSGWSIQPTFSATAPSWKTDSVAVLSAKYAMHGHVPYAAGDTAELVTPFYDCSSYKFVTLRFSHICKVLPCDICEIQYQEQGLGANYKWKPIPKDAYKGSCTLYKNNLNFSHESYSEWCANDTFATPNSGWYKQETFDITNYASLSKVRFRFLIRKGSYLGSFIAAGWFVDDFQVLASNVAIIPPEAKFLSGPTDTVYTTGPFVVEAKVATRTSVGIIAPKLECSFTYNGKTTKSSLRMTRISGDSIWTATIPQQLYGTTVTYAINASDSASNTAMISAGFYIKRVPGGGFTGYVTVGNGTSYQSYAPFYGLYDYGWARMLFRANELTQNSGGGMISKFAIQQYTTGNSSSNTPNQKIYFKAVKDTKISSGAYASPTTDGATLVWSGTYDASHTGWSEVTLTKPFILPAGENLMIYWENHNGSWISTINWYYTATSDYMCCYDYEDNNFPTTAGTLTYNRPNAQFYLTSIGRDDSNSVALISIDNPSGGSASGKQPVRITLKNKGTENLTSATVNWKVNNVLQTPKIYRGNLYCDFMDTLTLGSYTQRPNTYDTITVWVSMPNNRVDSTTDDDTLTVYSYGCDSMLHGIYTIGSSDSLHHYDFATVKDAMTLFGLCGINGDITLKLANGVYTESLDYANFSGIGGYNLTLASVSGNADSVVFRPKTGVAVNLTGASKIRFRNISFDARKSNSYCVQLGAGSKDLEFSHCTLYGKDTNISNNTFATIYANGTGMHDIRFIGNRILYGTYSTYFYGSSSARNRNIVFDSNYVAGFAYYGLYFYYNNNLKIIHNKVEEIKKGYNYFYGIYCNYSDSSIIDANIVRSHNYNTSTQNGIRCWYLDSNSVISNNEVCLQVSSSAYGIYLDYPYGVKVLNNTVLIYGKTTSTLYGIYQYTYTSGTYHSEIKNNISAVTGSSTCYPIYLTNATGAPLQCTDDYNCLWSPNNVGYVGTAQATLAAYKSAMPSAVHDVNLKPAFADSTLSLELNNFTGLDCPVHPNATRDLIGRYRVGKGSMGCYANAPLKNSASLTAWVNCPPTTSIGDTVCPSVVLMNCGTDTLKTATILWEYNKTLQGNGIAWKGGLALGETDTLPLGCVIMTPGLNTIKAYISGIGGPVDSTTTDDTLTYSTNSCKGTYAGAYTVGPKGDFPDLKTALTNISQCGVTGDITLNMASGTYATNINLDAYTGPNTYRITIASQAGIADSVIFRPTSGSVIKLAGKKNFAFRNITLDANSAKSYVVEIGAGNDDILFSHCHILGYNGKSTSNANSCIYSSSNKVNNLRFIGNEIIGGSYGIYMYGLSSNRNSNIVFDSNHIYNYYYYAAYLYYNNNLNFSHNFVEEGKDIYSYNYGVYIYYSDTLTANANRIRSYGNASSYEYGLRGNYLDSHSVVSNNDIIINTKGYGYGMYFDYPYGLHVVNNSVLIYGGSSQYGLYLWTYASGSYRSEIKNNILVCTGGTTPYPIYISNATGAATQCSEDYNCLWSDKNVGYVGSAQTTLAAYKSAMPSAVHDIYFHPTFKDSSISLEAKSYTGLACPRDNAVQTDLRGNTRLANTNMGCYSDKVVADNAGLADLLGVNAATYTSDTLCPSVILRNNGTNALTSATIRWEINQVVQGQDIPWKGNLALGQSDTIALGCFIPKAGNNTVKAYLVNTGSKDSIRTDDTISVSTLTCGNKMAGNYTIGSNGNFSTLTEALKQIKLCGMGGNITLAMANGTYTDNIDLNSFSGGQYVLTLTSQAGNADSVIIRPASGSVVSLTGTSGIRFRDLTFDANTAKGFCVEIGGNTQNVEFRYCHILGYNAKTTSNSYSTIYKGSGNTVKDIRFIGNEIIGGTYAIYFYGSSSTARNSNIVFDSNHIYNYYYYAAYLYYNNNLTFNHNFVEEGTDIYSYNYGVYVYYSDTFAANANRIRSYGNASSYEYGLRFLYTDSNSLISNNDIVLNSKGGAYGIYCDYPYGTKIINNSILVYGNGTSNLNGYYQYTYSSSTYWSYVKNNILVSNGNSPYPIYVTNAAGAAQCNADYNCLWSNKNVGYVGTAKTTLAAYQSALPSAVHDIFFHPMFKDSSISLELMNATGLSCPMDQSVSTDIKDSLRVNPTVMGAWNFKPSDVDMAVVSITSPAKHGNLQTNIPVKVVLGNFGKATVTTAKLYYSLNGTVSSPIQWNGSLKTGDTVSFTLGNIQLLEGVNRLTVFCSMPNNKIDGAMDNDTLHMNVYGCNGAYAGTYTIGNDTADKFANVNEAIEAMASCGMGGNVRLLVRSGRYPALKMENINFTDTNKTITIASLSNQNDVNFSGHIGATLSNVAHVYFENISIHGSKNGVKMDDQMTDVSFRGCEISVPKNSESDTCVAVVYENSSSSGKYLDNVRFTGNYISGGFTNFRFYYMASNGNLMSQASVIIDSNILDNAYAYGIYSYYYNHFKSISYNHITNRKGAKEYCGFLSYYYDNMDRMVGNRIHIDNDSTAFAVYFEDYTNYPSYGGKPGLIANNEIIVKGKDEKVGIYADEWCQLNIVNNSIYVKGSNNTVSYAVYTYSPSSSYKVNILNNNLVAAQDTGGYALVNDYDPSASYGVRDYNNYYSRSATLTYMDGADQGNLAAIKAVDASQDQHSLNIAPQWKDTMLYNLQINQSKLFPCPVTYNVTEDILGAPRTGTTAMGCYGLEPDSTDAALVELIGVDQLTSVGTHPVSAVLMNNGLKPLDTAVLRLSINGTAQTPVTYRPNAPLQYLKKDTVLLGTFAFQNGNCSLFASVSTPNDATASNDTLSAKRYICGKSFAGNIVIGNSNKADYSFQTIDTLITNITRCGIAGDLCLQIESGTYNLGNTTIDLSVFTGLLGKYRLTITSKAGNRDSVTVVSTASEFIYLYDNSNITISNMTLINQSGDIITFDGECKNIDILHNNLLASATTTSSTSGVPIDQYDGSIDGLNIIGNRIGGGYYGIYLYGTSSSEYNMNVVIDSNEIASQYYYATYLYYTDLASVSHNKIYCRTSNASSYWYGLRAYYCNIKQILGNDVDATLSSTITYPYGMYLYYINYYNTQNTALVANNIVKANTTSSYYGAYLYYSRMNFYHNTILMNGTGTGHALYYYSSSSYPMDIKGNQLFANAGGYPIYAGTTTSGVATLDYNNYYGGTYVGYFGNAISSLSAWQTATGMDVHSVSIAPNFINTANNLKLKSYAGMIMPRIKDVTEDFEGNIRDAMTVMGAYEAIYMQLDAALNDFGKTDIVGGQSSKVEVTLSNYGKDTLTTATIQWTFNGVAQTPFNWKGSLPMFGSTTVAIGNVMAATASTTNITAWISSANGKADMDHSNDTISMTTYVCGGSLSGTYTVGGTTPTFATLQDAIDALYTCKISGPVTLNVRTGNYGYLNITGPVPGASTTNTITVIADKGAHVVVNGGSAAPAISMNNTGYWKFIGITFGDTTSTQVGVQLEGKVSDILFHGCEILANATTTSSSSAAVRYPNTSGSANYPVNVEFIGNRIVGGYYNFYIYYMSGSSSNMAASSMTIDSNVMSQAYYAGIYSYYYSHYKSVSYNTIVSRQNTPATYYGFYNYEYSLIDRIDANRINISSTSTAYGIYFSWDKNQTTYGGKAGRMSNNEIIVRSSGSKYGIYAYYLNQDWEISHNSIYLEGTSYNYGLYLYNTSSSYKLKALSNISAVKGGSTNYPIYVSSATYVQPSYMILDYNDYVTLNGQSIGYAGNAISTLSAWQAASRQDTHSVSIAPAYFDSTRSLQLKDYNGLICPLLSTVPADIDGHKRTSITTMGAYGDNIFQGVDLSVEAFVAPQPIADVICYADYTPVKIAIKNVGLKKAQFNNSSLKIDLDVTGATTFHFDTLIKSGSLDYLEVDTLTLATVPTIASGTYNFKVTLTDAEDTTLSNNTLSLPYDAYRVELPYDIDFSKIPNEFVNITMAGNTAWKVVQGKGNNPALAPVFGTGRLEFAGTSDPGAYAHAVFNAVNIKDCVKPTLSFWYAHNANCASADVLTVLVTTDGGANYSEVQRILVTDTATAWKQYNIDLTPFNQSSCLSVVFRAMSFGGSDQSIDRIRITAERDASFTLLPIDISQRSACDPTPVEIKAVITNQTLMSIDMQNDTLSLNVSGAVNYANKVVFNKRLGGYASDTLTLGQLNLSANGYYYIEAFMQSKDDNTANDSIHDSTLYIKQDIAMDSIIGMDDKTYKVSGDKVSISAIAVNKGNILIDQVIFHMSIDGNEVVADTVRQPMKPGDTLIHAMSQQYTVPAVSKDQPYYFLEVSTELSCDADNTNDAISIVGNVNIPDSIDIQVLDITTTTPSKGKVKLAPSVRIANIGNKDADNVALHVDVIDNAGNVVESISELVSHLTANETKNVAFTMNYTVPNYTGKYTLKAYVETFKGDVLQQNDTLSKAFDCILDDTRIRESEGLNWSMGQNIPNPAAGITRIPFTLPQDATVVFSVMSANGQLIYREQVSAENGDNTIEFDVDGLAGGIYYYSMEYKGQRIVKKMNVVR